MLKAFMGIIAGLFFLIIFVQPAAAGNSGVAVAVKAGTLGAGVEATARLTDKLNLRLGGNKYDYEESGTEDGIDYDMETKLASTAALIDWHPFGGVFRLTAGALFNGNEIEINANPATTYTIGDNTYVVGLGDLNGKIDFDDVAPYASIGWGNAVGENKNFSFSFELGAVFQGSPNVELTTNIAGVSQDDLQKEEDNLEDELDEYDIYPVAAIGISYHF